VLARDFPNKGRRRTVRFKNEDETEMGGWIELLTRKSVVFIGALGAQCF